MLSNIYLLNLSKLKISMLRWASQNFLCAGLKDKYVFYPICICLERTHSLYIHTFSSQSMEILGKNVAEWGIAIKQKQWFIPDTLSVGLSNHLIDLLNKVLPENLYQPRLEIDDGMLGVMYGNGFHFLYNNQANNNLGSDGYDNYQAPTSQGNQLYSRRLWVKGSINFGANIVRASDQLNCIEKIDSVRRLGLSTFVNINSCLLYTSRCV